MTNSTREIVASFLTLFCQFVDFPKNNIDCSVEHPQICVRCKVRWTYFTGESINDFHSVALSYYIVLWAITVLLSLFAVFANVLIIKVMMKNSGEKHGGTFQLLLVVLANLDILCSIMCIVSATAFTSYSGSWLGRGKGTLYWCAISFYTTFFFRSASTYITVLISIKGYLMITFPVKANHWFTQNKTMLLVFITLFLAILTSYPRFASWTIVPNPWKDIESLKDLEYIINSTEQGIFFYLKMGNWHNKLDFWLPLPLLLLFNVLSFWKVHQLTNRRREMNVHTKSEMHAVKMFLPVVVAYFITNIIPIAHVISITVQQTTHRELYVLTFLAFAMNCAVNLPIYYFRNRTFKEATLKEITGLLSLLGSTRRILNTDSLQEQNTNTASLTSDSH